MYRSGYSRESGQPLAHQDSLLKEEGVWGWGAMGEEEWKIAISLRGQKGIEMKVHPP